MDDSLLITLVQQYEEIYNLKHKHYSNQQRRINIWEEIGEKMKQNGKYKVFIITNYLTYNTLRNAQNN